MSEKNDFPINYDKCPLCGCKKHVARTIADGMVAAGKLAPDKVTGTKVETIGIGDQLKATLTQTIIIKVYDVCWDCGHEHIIYTDKKEVAATMPGQTHGRQLPPDFMAR